MVKAAPLDQLDHSGSGAVRQGSAPDPKPKREPLQQFWSFRFTEEKVGSVDQLDQWLRVKAAAGRFQLEEGAGGQQHYQGVIHTLPRVRRTQLQELMKQEFPQLEFPAKDYLEPSKSKAADRYVMKEETRVDGPWEWGMPKEALDMTATEADVMKLGDLPAWSQWLVPQLTQGLPDPKDRRIFWIWSREGELYKTETGRHLAYHHQAVVIGGSRKHVLAVGYKNPAPIYLLAVPREDEGHVSYASLELLKDGMYMSAFGTEATGMVLRKKPWVVVTANFPPDVAKLPRLVVYCVDDHNPAFLAAPPSQPSIFGGSGGF